MSLKLIQSAMLCHSRPSIFVEIIILILISPTSWTQRLTAKTFEQMTSCSSGGNALMVTLGIDSTCLRKDQPSITITGLVATGVDNSGPITFVDQARTFSDVAILYGDLFLDDTTMYVNNVVSLGIAANDTIRIDGECLIVLRIDGIGCNRSYFVHPGCTNVLTVRRAQFGTEPAFHNDGALVYKVIAGALMDSNVLADGSIGVGNQQTVLNLDNVDGFSNISKSGDACYCLVDEEVMKINLVINLRGTITSVIRDASGAASTVLPSAWSSSDKYFQLMHMAFTDGANQGRRRIIQQYEGRRRLATLDAQPWAIEPGANYTITALVVDRGTHGTGRFPPLVSLGTVIPLGKPHRTRTPVYYTAAQHAVFPDTAQWAAGPGTLQAALLADWPLGFPRRAWLPVRNPGLPQPPPPSISIEVGRRPAQVDGSAGAYARFLLEAAAPAAGAAPPGAWPATIALLVCDPGTATAAGRLNCTACRTGSFSPACGGRACAACPPAAYTAAAGQTACTACDAGYACPGGTGKLPCPAGWYSDGGASACSICPALQYCPGLSAPVPCPPGTANPLPGQSACAACAPGAFAAEEGAAACAACAPGAYAAQPSATACRACAAGAIAAGAGAAACDPCPEDLYQPQGGATACLRCPANTGARWSMGLCSGACGGSASRGDCVCKAGFTDFGQAGGVCAAQRFESARAGQGTACAAGRNLLTVTFSANAALTTAVQEVAVRAAGRGYVPGRVGVEEAGGRHFQADFAVDAAGAVRGVAITAGGRGFGGRPEAVRLYYPADCAANVSECAATEQEGTVSRIVVESPGVGYAPGRVAVTGGGGAGCAATFEVDLCGGDALAEGCAQRFGAVTGAVFATAAGHGRGYVSAPSLELEYDGPVRCDSGANPAAAPRLGCQQDGTITTLRLTGARMFGCDTQTRVYAAGGGGAGFEARVTAVSPFGSILDTGLLIINHGAGYTSDPAVVIVGPPSCECGGNASAAPGAFAGCLQLVRAHGARLVAFRAGGASLGAVTGSEVRIAGLPPSVIPSQQVPVWSIPAVSVATHTTQSCGVLSDGSLVSWGKSETVQTDSKVMTWRCGVRTRYYRFVTIAARDGGRGVHLSEVELYAGSEKLAVVAATNLGGSNPPGFTASKAVDGDRETEWLDYKSMPLLLDLGQPYVVDKYRWMTAPDLSNLDPISWRLDAFVGSNDSLSDQLSNNAALDNWVTIHEMSKKWNSEYFFTGVPGPRNSTSYPRMRFTANFSGQCNFPLYKTWRHVSLGFSHGCGLTTAGVGLCWGRNDLGQLELIGEGCTCPRVYGKYCTCKSSNFDSQVYQKQVLEAAALQCVAGKCYNTYSDGTCESQGCEYIFDSGSCRTAGIAMQLVPDSTLQLLPQAVPIFPKGCYWITDPNVVSRLYFNRNNASSACTTARNCVCKNCPAFRFILFAAKGYCGGTLEDPGNEISGGKDLQSCTTLCGLDSTCDYFTFYPPEASVWCAPCCFKAASKCDLVNPDLIVPNVRGVKPTSKYDIISAGHLHTCGVISNGSAFCWGYNRNGQCNIPASHKKRIWKSVSAGRFHSCGILDDSTVQCWGAEGDISVNVGQVLPIPGNGAFKWLYISVGAWHSCGISNDGMLHCWGCGGYDRLGRPIGITSWGERVDKGQCTVPLGVNNWLSVSCGEYHTCAVASNGSGYCWGCKCNPKLCPSWNSTDIDFGQCNIPGEQQLWSYIAAGMYHSCGLSQRGIIICWGASPNSSLPFWNSDGGAVQNDASYQGKFNFGQIDPPPVEQWMNPALFKSFGTYKDGVLSMPVRENSLPGSYYLFSFPLVNPAKQSSALNLSIFSEGLSMPPLQVTNAMGPLGPARVVSCSPGTYDPEKCIPCQPGSYAIDCGVSTCVACNPGQYSSVGASICTDCPYGTFADSSGSTICKACSDGSFGNVTGAISYYDGCRKCEEGTFSDTFHQYDAVAGVWNLVGASACELCPRGHFCEGGQSKIACPVGTWSAEVGATDLTACLSCSRPERCTNEWPRFICSAKDGYANGSIFYDLSTCTASCTTLSLEPGLCLAQPGQNNGCTLGYAGSTCKNCFAHHYLDLIDEKCKPCPFGWSKLSILGIYTLTVLVFLSGCELFVVDWRVSAYCRTFLIFLQCLDLSLAVNVRWPDFLAEYVMWLRILDFHIPSTLPECFLENTAENWFKFYQLLVLVPLVIFGGISALSFVPWQGVRLQKSFARLAMSVGVWYAIPFLNSLLGPLICSCVPLGYELLRKTWYNCTNPLSQYVLNENPYILCSEESHETAVKISLWIIGFVCIPVPAAIFLLIPQNDCPADSGTVAVFNIGKVEESNNNIHGCGWLHRLQKEIFQAKLFLSAAKIDLDRLHDIQLDEQACGRKKEFMQAYNEFQIISEAYHVLSSRHDMLIELFAELQNSVKQDEAFQAQEVFQRQALAIWKCRHRIYHYTLNFVNTVKHQKTSCQRATKVLEKVTFRQGKGWFHTSMVYVHWKSARQFIRKWTVKRNAFEKYSAETFFWISTVMLMPLALSGIFTSWARVRIRTLMLPSQKIQIEYFWAAYGRKEKLEGQVVHFRFPPTKPDIYKGKLAMIHRGQGIMHESSLVKVDRAVDAGAAGVILVNHSNTPFTPKAVSENFMLVRICNIPVIGISAKDAQRISDGAHASIRLRFPTRLVGLKRLRLLLGSLFSSLIMDTYRVGKNWFAIIVLLRCTALVIISKFGFRNMQMQSYIVLFIQLTYFIFSLQCPYADEVLNKFDIATSFCCLATALLVATVTSVLGSTSESSVGLELKGTAGFTEDLIRAQIFQGLSLGILLFFLTTCLYLISKWSLMLIDLLVGLTSRKQEIFEKEKPKMIQEPVLEIDPIRVPFISALDAVVEFQRAFPMSSLSDCALTSVLGGISKQIELDEIKNQIREARIRRNPWVHSQTIGVAGFCEGKDVTIFFNQVRGTVVELAANSSGEIRFRPSKDSRIYGLAHGMLWERESFLAPKKVAEIESDAGNFLGAAFAPDFGLWLCILHTPDLLISHQNKSAQVWLTRRGCAVQIGGTTGLLIEAGQHPRLVSPEAVSEFIGTGRSSFQSALLAISAARRTQRERRRRPKQEKDLIPRPESALEAILQALDLESVTQNDSNGGIGCAQQGDYSGKHVDLRRRLVVSESVGSKPDQEVSHSPFPDNSPVVPWRRGGDRGVRRPPSLVKSKAQVAPAPSNHNDERM